jgi:alcohol dehydrogenase (cytochrome c)
MAHFARLENGKERWRKKIADEKRQYFTTTAPLVIKNYVIVGVGGDAMDVPGFESRDPGPASSNGAG